VTNPTATGWGTTFGGMPVVRMPGYFDSVDIKGTNVLDRIAAAVAPLVPLSGNTGAVDLTSSAYVRVPTPVNGTDAATADWVLDQLAVGNPIYFTTNTAETAFTPTGTTYFGSSDLPPDSQPLTIGVVSNGQYAATFIYDTPVTGVLQAPMSLNMKLFIPAGVPAANYSLSLEPIFGYVADTNAPVMQGSWPGGAKVLTPGVTNTIPWSVTFANTTVTNVWLAVRFRVSNKGSAVNYFDLLVGDGTASHGMLRSTESVGLGERGATNFVIAAGCSVVTNVDYSEETRTATASGYALPVAGSTELALDGTNLTITGATYAYRATVTNDYQLAVDEDAPAYHYSLTVLGTNAFSIAPNLLLRGTAWTPGGTNLVAFAPWSNGVWECIGVAK